MTDQILQRELSAALEMLSPGQRDQLLTMLQDPSRRRAFQQLIESALKLSNGSASSQKRPSEAKVRSEAAVSVAGGYDEESLWRSFASVFGDKESFPTTGAVIDAAKYFFNCNLNRRRFQKAGRRGAIAEIWRQVSALPARERSDRLQHFFQRFEHLLDPHRSYRELFRVLSRSE